MGKNPIIAESDYSARSEAFRQRARDVLHASDIEGIWRRAGCRVNIIGSMAMGLMAKHRDIDIHVYSPQITEQSSFEIAAEIVADPRVKELKCVNGLHSDEQCIAWHALYEYEPGEFWQIDIIHIVAGTRFDGFFEEMARRVTLLATTQQKETILRLKFTTPDDEEIQGVEYYEAVMSGGVSSLPQLRRWLEQRRSIPPHYWMPAPQTP